MEDCRGASDYEQDEYASHMLNLDPDFWGRYVHYVAICLWFCDYQDDVFF